jgi:hypothetical protein
MAEAGTVSIAIVCEADADRRTVCALTDRVLVAEGDGVSSENLSDRRQFQGLSDADSFLKVSQVWSLARDRGVRSDGFFKGRPAAPHARVARAAFLMLQKTKPRPNAVFFIVDTDNDTARRDGCDQARKAEPWKFAVVIGLPHTKRECWVLAGYDPSNEADKTSLADVCQELGFDPRTNSHELTAKHDSDKKSAKRIVRLLVGDNETCFENCDLSLLQQRGQHNGLSSFLSELRSHLLPLFTRAARNP